MRARSIRFATTFAVLFSGAVAVGPATADAVAGTDTVTVVVANGESLTYLDVPANQVSALIADGGVVAVAKPSLMTAASSWPSDDAYASDQWAIPAAGFDALPARADGTGIVVAVIDTGVRADHEDLIGRVSDGGDFVSGSSKTLSDPGGHGTHVAGIIAAKHDNHVGIAGGAPGVTIIAYRVLGPSGGSAADVAEAITEAVDAGANVINLSLGGQSNAAVSAAVANAVERGTLVVAAAGNGGLKGNTPEWPGADPNAIGVGATMDGGDRADFSTTGPQLDLAAPGWDIWSTYNKSSSSYTEMYGTSMASPYVAAAAAAIWSAHPEATAAQVREALESSATDLGTPGRDDEYGAGQVDAANALVALDAIVGRAPARYTTVEPFRVFDTRAGGGVRNVARSPIGSVDNVLEVQLTDLAGVIPTNDVAAVSLNVTVTNTTESGFATVYPCGSRPNVSSLNYPAGGTVANAVITRVSPTGTVCFFSSTVADLLVDVNGWYPSVSGYHAPNPIRVFDTRAGATGYRDVARHSIDANHPLEVQITDIINTVPRTGVAAVSLNVTAVNTAAAGYLTVYPCGARPDVSSVNFPSGGAVANAVLTPVSANGTVCFASSAPADVIVDVNGWFSTTGSSYHPTGPQRLFDTRSSGTGLRPVQSGAVGTTYILVVPATGLGGYVPATGVAAVSLNVTATGSASDGYATVYPCGPARPDVSSLNYRGSTTVANAVIVPVAANGTICLYSSSPTQLIADVNGWFAT
jgi:hypothetical protein